MTYIFQDFLDSLGVFSISVLVEVNVYIFKIAVGGENSIAIHDYDDVFLCI